MFLKKVKNKRTGRTYLSIVHGYRDKVTKKSKSKTIESLGYLDELEKKYDDPIAFFETKVKQMNQQQNEDKFTMTFRVSNEDRLEKDESNRKNFGYAALSKIYHELGIHTFLTNRQRHIKSGYDANSIMKLLVFARLLYPGSKKKTYENKDTFFENTNFSLDDVYRCLPFFNKHKDALQLWIHERIKEQYDRNTSLVYYDVTNYYFEIDDPDDLRKKGVSKEHRPDPIVQMGLFIDTNGIPITYGLHPGNMLDKQTLIPMLGNIQRHFSLGRTIVVADKGMTTGDNIWYTLSAKNGYVLSYSVRGANKKFKDYVLDQNNYRTIGKGFKIKSRLYPREITVTSRNGKKLKKRVDEKQVIFYSEKYAQKAKADRAPALKKAKDLIDSPSRFNKATSVGAAKYVKNLTFDKKTGEILKDAKEALLLDEEKLRKEEAFDGYYAIITSEFEESDERIIEIYRGLWKIEESFRVTKSDLESRPVYLSRPEHIEAHFLTCFVSLVIARVLEHRLKGKHSITAIIESLKKASCSHIQENYYLFDHYDEILAAIGKELNLDFGKKYMSLGEIKKILGEVKKG
ncbi:IS1634 family transposase [Virgibacillus dakarensis]|uniref:IS1634 family transposase n=1 Tax=Virgibacillus dakarensis TaxID=1917889 RepID=UPI000B447EFA|nr:IS1634 family transposase [Virgibacillus dakarensis]MBT2218667.1 IS1634 family transposase [Virgibacillus dakarensis]MTW88382.1 IS1634 family transposase [Virgibacillus dakarensis]